MGNYETPRKLDAGMIYSLPGGLCIVANAADIDLLRASALSGHFDNTTFLPLPPDAELPAGAIDAAQVLVLEVDPGNDASLRRMAKVRSERENLPIIAAIRQTDVALVRTLIRQGITDVAVLPFAPDELTSQILDATTALAERMPQVELSPLFTVVRSTGGCGATTVITHLAAALAKTKTSKRGVCVIDLDLQSGDVVSFVGETPKVTIAALLEAGERLDKELLRNAVTETRYGFSVIASPPAITPLDTVDIDQLLKILALARKHYDYVLIDLPSDWTNWALSVVLASTEVLLITDLSISSLRQAKRRLELFSSVGLDKGRIGIVVNRVERRLFKAIGLDEVRDTLGYEVLAGLALEGSDLRSAQDQGVLVSDVVNRSRFVGDVRSLAELLASIER